MHMKTLGYKLYCPECRKIVEVYECNSQGKVLPEIKPEFDVITVCCSICNKPVMKVTKLHVKK
ncbi:MAG: hypothetical protein ACP5ER_05415 [Candidatus Bathyarchaeales archaeon]